MGRITNARLGSDGTIREVELATSTHRKIRRPVNLLVPLEVNAGDVMEAHHRDESQTHQHEEVPELEPGNHFPGRTGCMESCGGPGCGCVIPSAGCLFYRVFATPRNDRIYEIFGCARWAEETKISVTIEDINASLAARNFVLALTPNVPKELPLFTITMTSISLPPTPSLITSFITDGRDIALWDDTLKPHLVCPTAGHARTLNCSFYDDCTCNAAETIVKCTCSDVDITAEFGRIASKLPITTAAWEMQKRSNSVVTKISSMVSADFMIEFNQTIDTSTKVTSSQTCDVANGAVEDQQRNMSTLTPVSRSQLLLNLRMEKLKNQQLRKQNKRLMEALEPLPQPRELFDMLVRTFTEVSHTCRAVLRLDTNIDLLKFSQDHPYVKHLRINTLDTQIEALRLRFHLARAELVLLHKQYAGLTATKRLTPELWETYLAETHLDAEDQPIVLDPSLQEQLIQNYMEFLGNYSVALATVRQSIEEDNDYDQYRDDLLRTQEAWSCERNSFQDVVMSRLDTIYGMLSATTRKTVEQNVIVQTQETKDNPPSAAVTPATNRALPADTREIEQRRIQDNVGFLESIEIDVNSPQQLQPENDEGLVVVDEVESGEEDSDIVVVVDNPPKRARMSPAQEEPRRRVISTSEYAKRQYAEAQHSRDTDIQQQRYAKDSPHPRADESESLEQQLKIQRN
ncbi:hypothetical protein COOONC_16478 [Cooperia oncophora]